MSGATKNLMVTRRGDAVSVATTRRTYALKIGETYAAKTSAKEASDAVTLVELLPNARAIVRYPSGKCRDVQLAHVIHTYQTPFREKHPKRASSSSSSTTPAAAPLSSSAIGFAFSEVLAQLARVEGKLDELVKEWRGSASEVSP